MGSMQGMKEDYITIQSMNELNDEEIDKNGNQWWKENIWHKHMNITEIQKTNTNWIINTTKNNRK